MIKQFEVTIDRLPTIIEKIVYEGKLELGVSMLPVQAVEIEGQITRDFPSFHASNDQFYKVGWPTNVFKLEASPIFRVSPQVSQLVALGQPLFDSAAQAISDFFKLDFNIAGCVESSGEALTI